MKLQQKRQKREIGPRLLGVTLIGIGAAIALHVGVSALGNSPLGPQTADRTPGPDATGAEATSGPSRMAGGLRAYRDPLTGERRLPPPGREPTLAPGAPLGTMSRSLQGLIQERGPTHAGGVRVDLRGRFRSALVATRNKDGSVSTHCIESPITGERRE